MLESATRAEWNLSQSRKTTQPQSRKASTPVLHLNCVSALYHSIWSTYLILLCADASISVQIVTTMLMYNGHVVRQ